MMKSLTNKNKLISKIISDPKEASRLTDEIQKNKHKDEFNFEYEGKKIKIKQLGIK